MNINIEGLVEKLVEVVSTYGLKILAAIAILIIGKIIAKMVTKGVSKALGKANLDSALVGFVSKLAYTGLIIFVVIAALSQVGIQTTSFIAILGAAGLAVGLALQGSLSNFAAGVLLLIFKPIKLEDYVIAGGAEGIVKDIGIFTCTVLTVDNKRIIVPNSKLMGDNITNFSAEENRRVDLVIGVSYGDNLDKVKTVLTQAIAGVPLVLKDPGVTIAVSELADNSVNLVVRPWCKTPDYWTVYFSATEAIKKAFDKEGISIPFPQRDVHMISK